MLAHSRIFEIAGTICLFCTSRPWTRPRLCREGSEAAQNTQTKYNFLIICSLRIISRFKIQEKTGAAGPHNSQQLPSKSIRHRQPARAVQQTCNRNMSENNTYKIDGIRMKHQFSCIIHCDERNGGVLRRASHWTIFLLVVTAVVMSALQAIRELRMANDAATDMLMQHWLDDCSGSIAFLLPRILIWGSAVDACRCMLVCRNWRRYAGNANGCLLNFEFMLIYCMKHR